MCYGEGWESKGELEKAFDMTVLINRWHEYTAPFHNALLTVT